MHTSTSEALADGDRAIRARIQRLTTRVLHDPLVLPPTFSLRFCILSLACACVLSGCAPAATTKAKAGASSNTSALIVGEPVSPAAAQTETAEHATDPPSLAELQAQRQSDKVLDPVGDGRAIYADLLPDGTISDGVDPFIGDLYPPALTLPIGLRQEDIPAGWDGSAADESSADDPEVMAAKQGTIRVLAMRCGGGIVSATGWMYGPNIAITTATAVGRNQRRPRIRITDTGRTYPARIAYFNAELDVAVLTVPGISGITPLPLVKGAGEGTEAAVVGYPNGRWQRPDAIQLGPVIVDDMDAHDAFGYKMASRTSRLVGGLSIHGAPGSPLINRSGAVIGMLWGHQPQAGVPTGLAVTAEDLAEVMRSTYANDLQPGVCRTRDTQWHMKIA